MKRLLLAITLAIAALAVMPTKAEAYCYGPDAAQIGVYAVNEYIYAYGDSYGSQEALRWDAYTAGINAITYYVWEQCLSPLTGFSMQVYMDWYNFWVAGYDPEGNFWTLYWWVQNNLATNPT